MTSPSPHRPADGAADDVVAPADQTVQSSIGSAEAAEGVEAAAEPLVPPAPPSPSRPLQPRRLSAALSTAARRYARGRDGLVPSSGWTLAVDGDTATVSWRVKGSGHEGFYDDDIAAIVVTLLAHGYEVDLQDRGGETAPADWADTGDVHRLFVRRLTEADQVNVAVVGAAALWHALQAGVAVQESLEMLRRGTFDPRTVQTLGALRRQP